MNIDSLLKMIKKTKVSLLTLLNFFFHLFSFQFGRTEMVKDCLSPEFEKKFIMQYFFEQSQKLMFEL